MEFEPITTQEEFDKAAAEIRKEYEGFISAKDAEKLNAKIAEQAATITDLTAKNQAHEINGLKARIAHEKGIPYELASRLNGSTEEEITADAETLGGYLTAAKPAREPKPAPPYSTETPINGSTDAAYSAMLQSLNE